MRAPVDTIAAPLFPTKLPWVNTNGAQASILKRGQPMLVEFWDFCRPNSIRTLPYVKAWHERYADDGLRVIGVHCPGFEPSHDEQAVREAVARLEIAHPVLIDSEFEVWQEYENRGWPARYLFDGHARLFDYHYGEGGYEETELAIQELLGIEREPLAPLRPEDAPDAQLLPQTREHQGPWSGRYEAGSVWAVLTPSGHADAATNGNRTDSPRGQLSTVAIDVEDSNGAVAPTRTLVVEHPGAYLLIQHERHTAGVLGLELGGGVECLATCFTPGVA
ncbi:MAG: DipZ protein [Solirubrobacteraceae bacterium]